MGITLKILLKSKSWYSLLRKFHIISLGVLLVSHLNDTAYCGKMTKPYFFIHTYSGLWVQTLITWIMKNRICQIFFNQTSTIQRNAMWHGLMNISGNGTRFWNSLKSRRHLVMFERTHFNFSPLMPWCSDTRKLQYIVTKETIHM